MFGNKGGREGGVRGGTPTRASINLNLNKLATGIG